MNDDIIQDLKQFIATTVSQEVTEVRSDIKALDNKLTTKIDDLSNSVADAIENTNVTADSQLKEHEQRIARLEHKTV